MSPWAFPLVKIAGPIIWSCSIPLSFPSWAQCGFQLGLPPYSMPGWPTWLPNSWAGTNSMIIGLMASLVMYLMRAMIEISPLITSNICAGLAFPTLLPSLAIQCYPMDTFISYSWYPPGTSCKGGVVATGVKLFPEKD